MSSLLQFGGKIRGGKCGLLFYLQHEVETPMRCMQCGQPWTEGDVHCTKCNRFVLFSHQYESYDDIAGQVMKDGVWYSEKYPEAYGAINPIVLGTTTVSNWWNMVDSETVIMHRPDGTDTTVPKLYRIWRAPSGTMCGPWVGFKYNGSTHYPDLSCPIAVTKLPRGAKPLSYEEAAEYWFN